MMPEMDGYAVLMKLRESPFTCNIPVIFLTSLAGAEDEERGLEVGASDYLSKPIKPAVLLARVRNQLEAKQTRDWLRNRDADLEAEVDAPLRSWRRRLRVFRAIELLSSGMSVTSAAMELGYGSPSAFIFAFRGEMGKSPHAFVRQNPGPMARR